MLDSRRDITASLGAVYSSKPVKFRWLPSTPANPSKFSLLQEGLSGSEGLL
jgi:hypothetical protein